MTEESNSKINVTPLRGLTDFEYESILLIKQLKEKFGLKGESSSWTKEVAEMGVFANIAESKMRNHLIKKFGLTKEQMDKEGFDLRIVSGNFLEIIDEKKNNTSGEQQ